MFVLFATPPIKFKDVDEDEDGDEDGDDNFMTTFKELSIITAILLLLLIPATPVPCVHLDC